MEATKMNDTLIARKNQLKAEISIAREMLNQNMENIRFRDYLHAGNLGAIGGLGALFDGPADAVVKIDAFSRTMFSPDNPIRTFFKYCNVAVKAYDMINGSDPEENSSSKLTTPPNRMGPIQVRDIESIS